MQRSKTGSAIVLTAAALLTGCGDAQPLTRHPATAAPAAHGITNTAATASVAALWSQSCALCHVNGEGGAPRIGQPDEWQARIAQGKRVLLRHTLEGFNNMPPLGYCMRCEQEDFEALIQLMTEQR